MIVTLLAFAVFCAPVLLIAGRRDSPVVWVEEVDARVVSFCLGPTNPKRSAGRGHWIQYSVQLPGNNGYARVIGPVGHPRGIGSEVTLVRTIRENGSATYTFKETPWMQVGS